MQIQIFHHPSMPMDLSLCLPKLRTFSGSQPRPAEELATYHPHSASCQVGFHSGRSPPPSLAAELWASLLPTQASDSASVNTGAVLVPGATVHFR